MPSRRGNTGMDVLQKTRTKLMELQVLDIQPVPRKMLARAADYKSAKQAGFVKVLGLLKSAGFIEYEPGEMVRLSAKGIQETPTPLPPSDNAEARARLFLILYISNPSKITKLDMICQFLSDGLAHTSEEIGAAAGYDDIGSPGFVKVIGTLVGLLVVTKIAGSPGSYMLTDVCFPFGRGHR